MRAKRILFVEQNRDGTVGGSHRALLALVQHLDRSRFEPIVAFYEPHALLDEFRACAPVILLTAHEPARFGVGLKGPARVAAVGARKAINLARAGAAVSARMAQVVARVRPHVIHMNNCVRTGAEWPIVAALCGIPTVVHQRGFVPPLGYARRFDRIVCVSRAVETHLQQAWPVLADRILQIYDGVDVDEVRHRARVELPVNLRRSLGASDDEVLIGVAGNLLPWKGQDVLLEALAHLSFRAPWRCFVIGGVPTSAESRAFDRRLRQLARTHPMRERIVFTGYRPDVPALMSLLDVVVHTSVEPEPLGLVVLEGMVLGKPVIATNHGGPTEAIKHGRSGFLVPPGDAAALAACLDGVLASPDLRARVGAAAMVRVERRFGVARHVASMQDVYRSLWPERRNAATASAGARAVLGARD